ncbi:LANO_0B08460g1_1 [Lachancea nothofagi CBS 11611]|uniref:LANO_0B08460g1_1 n=1 Tax=Lachancea nothofagi CBS 11611 TaxID=1266666 RepID=A0A1G4J0R1_9SACH|nr:LANO_0B08460g1_1 [Lachancea nothofagi CBS 11611]
MRLGFLIATVLASSQAVAQTEITQPSVEDTTNFCKMDKDSLVGASCDVTFKEINEINSKIRPELLSLVHSDFFKYFKLDLYKQCTFWNDNNGYCVNRACAVDVVEEWDQLPEYWQPEVLGGLANESLSDDEALNDECSFLDQLCDNSQLRINKNGPDIDYCDTGDFHNKQSVLVDLTANPERFTGYGGEQSSQIWSSIYRENCFSQNETGQCLAKDAFYRLVSGLHASIGTHLSNDHLNTETGRWEPNLELFMARVGDFPDRVANIYFNYAVVAKALWKIQPYLAHLNFCNAYHEDVKSMITSVVSNLDSKIFNENLLFNDDISSNLKDDFRSRFKNVTKIMDCVHCDRCRMWGKVQTTGYATSLKILFEIDSEDEKAKQNVVDKLTKYELIALFNTFDRLSKSIESINNFEKLYTDRLLTAGDRILALFKSNNFFKLLGNAGKSFSSSLRNRSDDSVISELEISEPAITEHKMAEAEIEKPEIEKPEINEYEVVEPKTTENEVAEPNVAEPTTAEPEDAEPKTAEPEEDEPTTVEPEEAEPTTAEPETEVKFQDVKLPPQKDVLRKLESNNTIIKAWNTEVHNLNVALRFIFHSYLDLPRNIARMALYRLNSFWNFFVGVPKYVNDEDQNQATYELNIQ